MSLVWVPVAALASGCAAGVGGRADASETDAETIGPSTGEVDDGRGVDDGGGPTNTSSPDASSSEATGDPTGAVDDTTTSTPEGPVCGDAVVEGDEVCDDGNTDDSDACTTLCAPPSCADGIQSGDESDIDCGGGCDPCVAGGTCRSDADCRNQACTAGICAPAASCSELLGLHPGLADGGYTIDPNGGSAADAVSVFCDMSTGGGGWTALAANGDISVPETAEPGDCYPLLTAQAGEGCGDASDLMSDFAVVGDQQGELSWRYLMAIAYGDGGYDDKLAFFAIDFGASQTTAEERFNGISYVPTGITTDFGEIACTGYSIVHYTRSGTYNPSGIADGKGTVFGHDSTITMNDSARRTFGFTDASDAGAAQSGSGVDDYQDGWSCSDMWAPQQVRGARMVVLVR